MFGRVRSAARCRAARGDAWANYKTARSTTACPLGLDRVAALIAADFPTKIYYVAYRNNASTPTSTERRSRPPVDHTSDHIAAFVKDVARLRRGNDVVLMASANSGGA